MLLVIICESSVFVVATCDSVADELGLWPNLSFRSANKLVCDPCREAGGGVAAVGRVSGWD